MNAAASRANWSESQRRCLDALGYTLYRPATPTVGEAGANPLAATRLVDNTMDDASAMQRRAGNRGTTTRAHADPLVVALLRAAGLSSAQCDDTTAWLRARQIPSLTQLRNNPAAKRALWPRLRMLRRERSQR